MLCVHSMAVSLERSFIFTHSRVLVILCQHRSCKCYTLGKKTNKMCTSLLHSSCRRCLTSPRERDTQSERASERARERERERERDFIRKQCP